jgi:hypothetical protein
LGPGLGTPFTAAARRLIRESVDGLTGEDPG